MDLDETRNGSGDSDDDYTNIYFIVGDRRETASFRPDQVTNKELKELFRSAADAGPLDIVKLRQGDKLLNISPQLQANTPDTPYVLQVVGAHPASSGMIEADLLRALERRVAVLERELRDHQEAASSEPSIALRDLKRQMDAFKSKLETTEHLSWLGFYKQLPEPVSSEACRRLQYRRKSDSVKRRVREKFLNICDVAVSSSVREWLRSPAFDARQWEDEELLLMLQTMFVELELPQKFDISLMTLRNFLFEVYNNYNEVPFHNFRHCFCVAQMTLKEDMILKRMQRRISHIASSLYDKLHKASSMRKPKLINILPHGLRERFRIMRKQCMYAIAWAVNLPERIGHLEVFVLIVSCICHDLDHPGYNNIYQINARTELALRYNDISPLENHHCSVAFRVLEAPECNILTSLDPATFRTVREGIIRCILATDMARHNEILSQFTDTVPEFDYENKTHINLLSMILIKVADISNEARPMDVAEPWLDRLLQEFFKQSDAEKLEGLPVTPFMDRDKVTKPSSQCSFIGLVLLPLFESLGELLPELQEFIIQPVRFALEYYRRLNEAAKDERHHRKSVIDLGESAILVSSGTGSSSVTKSMSSHSMRSKRSGGTIRSRSRSTDEDPENPTIEEGDNLESSDPETATEVEVSEKTLKFKISTEGSVTTPSGTGRKSYPGSRKGSREKSSLDYHNHDLAKAVRDHDRERRRSRGENLSSDMSSPVSARSGEETRILEEFESDETTFVEGRIREERSESNNGNVIPIESVSGGRNRAKKRPSVAENDEEDDANNDEEDDNNADDDDDDDDDEDVRVGRKSSVVANVGNIRCCCDDKSVSNNHKSLLSRLRNFTDRLSISFDSKESPLTKPTKHHANVRTLMKCESVSSSATAISPKRNISSGILCKRCNLVKFCKESVPTTVVEIASLDKRAMTLPKARKSQDGKNKSWRMVFVKEKRPSASLETLPAHDAVTTNAKHRRNLSNPEGKIHLTKTLKDTDDEKRLNFNDFKEIDVRTSKKPAIIVHPGSSNIVDNDDDIGKVEIRRSSASMEDISKITKQNEGILLGSLEDKKADELQHTGSLDSMLYNESAKSVKKPFGFPSPYTTKKSTPGLFSRFKSGMSIDGTRSSSNSGSLHDQTPQQQQTGWISSLTASFRPKRQTGELQTTVPHTLHSPTHEGVK